MQKYVKSNIVTQYDKIIKNLKNSYKTGIKNKSMSYE